MGKELVIKREIFFDRIFFLFRLIKMPFFRHILDATLGNIFNIMTMTITIINTNKEPKTKSPYIFV